ncbi:MAG TPA: translation initiation factor IF-2, partial [Planctomycetes bacterium]|nr:translation initiation factor IF-2 [Planctomycetota bacterium]
SKDEAAEKGTSPEETIKEEEEEELIPAKATEEEPAKEPTGVPTPTAKPGASKVGKIDLAALGLIKSRQQATKKSATFTDIRDNQSSRRRDHRARQRDRMKARKAGTMPPKHVSTVERKKDVILDYPVTVRSFSAAAGIPINELLRLLMTLGAATNQNANLDSATVELLATETGINVQIKEEADAEEGLMEEIQAARSTVDPESLGPRPPVITFLGHVDHGKTSLVDAIRESRIAQKEAGGITQHIGAYTAALADGRKVTVLDTPGHEAFTAMRARGAQTTDIAVLVVAANDGVMAQTEEAANHAKSAGVPIVVAINKMDVAGANADQVKSQLSGIGIQTEDWGGEIGAVEVSALQKKGIEELLERVLLEAEVLDLKAHSTGDAMGVILESKVEKGKGKVAHALVQDGTLKVKDVVLAGPTFGKIRLMFDADGKPMKSAGPSTPVEILGLEELPIVGEKFYAVKDIKAAKEVAVKRAERRQDRERAKQSGTTAQALMEQIDESLAARIRYVLKGDVQGSVEVLSETLIGMSTEEVKVDVIHSGVGAVTETDVNLAEAADAVVIGFHVVPDSKTRKTAERAHVEIRRYDVIYDLIEDTEKAILGSLAPKEEEKIVGHADVLQVFRSSRWGSIAGSKVTDGILSRNCHARLIRDGAVIYEAPFASLRHFKDDVREVKEGNECGIKIQDFEDIKAGDVIEAFIMVEKERTLEELQAIQQDDASTDGEEVSEG